MSTDIKLFKGEIAISYEDLEFVEGGDCLLQDIRSRLFTDRGALFYDPSYGGKALRYIHGSRDDTTMQELKQAVKIALKSDDRIISNSLNISIKDEKNGEDTMSEVQLSTGCTSTTASIKIYIEFISSDNEKLETEVAI